MKNISAIFYSVLTFSIFSISCVSVGEKAATIAVNGLDVASQRLSNDLGGASQSFSNGLGAASQQLSNDLGATSEQLSNAITKAAPTVGADAAKNLGDAGIAISKNLVLGVGIIAGVYTLREIAYAGKDLYQYCYPDEDKKKRIQEAEEAIAIINTKRIFRTCLMKNAKGQRNKIDLPVACEECGYAFASTAGPAAFEDMARLFKQVY